MKRFQFNFVQKNQRFRNQTRENPNLYRLVIILCVQIKWEKFIFCNLKMCIKYYCVTVIELINFILLYQKVPKRLVICWKFVFCLGSLEKHGYRKKWSKLYISQRLIKGYETRKYFFIITNDEFFTLTPNQSIQRLYTNFFDLHVLNVAIELEK